MNLNNKNYIKITTGVLFVLIVFGAGFFLGFNKQMSSEKISAFINPDVTTEDQADFAPFWKVWNTIDQKFPGASEISSEERVYGAISGLIGSLEDPYSQFFEPDQAKTFEEEISGNFVGIGVEIDTKNGTLNVIAPLTDTPADKAGILSGDTILKIDEVSTENITIDEAVKLIRGEKGTTVTLSVLHKGEKSPVDIKIVRDTINIPTLDSKLRDDGVYVVSLYNFSANSANLFRNAMKKFQASKSDKLIIDLRGNPGGYLNAAVDMVSWFLPGGKTIAIEDFGGGKEQKLYRSSGYNAFGDNLHIVVLIDQGSASASEIVAGALRDHKKAILVGEQSYGKGSVQEVVKVTPTTLFKVTVAKWLTPLGTSISLKGLTPDFVVKLTKDDVTNKRDPQMEKALKVVKNWPGIK